jgi:outer membrane protein OmpA-like peptidoglycan-associated protein
LVAGLENDAAFTNPQVAAEAQAKFDCWLSASASGQTGTADECRVRFEKAIGALDCGGKTVDNLGASRRVIETKKTTTEVIKPVYPDTRNMASMSGRGRARDGVIIVNNVNVPEHLINPQPVQPMVFNQNIYGGDKSVTKTQTDCDTPDCRPVEVPIIAENEDYVTRAEFVDMMLALRAELAAINSRLDAIESERMMIKVQQIPQSPKQHVMEEVLEIQFDFDKAIVKPEYKDIIRKLAATCQENSNVRVTVVGHTDTSGSEAYNYALGERRAAAVAKILIANGIPAGQIVKVSAGETDLKVPTGDGVPKRENRRATVNKETRTTEYVAPIVAVEEYVMPRQMTAPRYTGKPQPLTWEQAEAQGMYGDCGGHGCG